MKALKIRDMVFIALFAAIIAVISQLIIPLPSGIPLTLQTFIIALCGYCLGSYKGLAAVLVYIAVGIAGVPVFTGFRGGIGALFDITGGFIAGFLPLVFMCGVKAEKKLLKLISGFIGVIFCHLCGVLWFSVLSGDIRSAFLVGSAPYILKDFISTGIAAFFSSRINKIMQKFN